MIDREHHLKKRINALVSEESADPPAWWWLSFCDPSLPEGDQFLGACIVQAKGFLLATMRARMLGCNPGGECQGVGPMEELPPALANATDRLLSRAECEELDAA
jgi:hypothetical protein